MALSDADVQKQVNIGTNIEQIAISEIFSIVKYFSRFSRI
jgi:hypothetical protein